VDRTHKEALMKKLFLFTMIIFAVGFLIYGFHLPLPAIAAGNRVSAGFVHQDRANVSGAEIPADTHSLSWNRKRKEQIEKVNGEVQTLTAQLQDVDHDLERAGFPKVFLDSRLSKSERAGLLSKVERSSRLQNEIVLLKIQQIDLTSSENL
jgi:hypothetical protein